MKQSPKKTKSCQGDKTCHRCHFPGCTTRSPRKRLYCKPHWFMMPAAYDALPHGPAGNCLRVSKEWIAAVDDAEEATRGSDQHKVLIRRYKIG